MTQKPEMPEELLPCPFCGREALVHWEFDVVSCSNFEGECCGVSISTSVKKWNTRSDATRHAETVEVLKVLLESVCDDLNDDRKYFSTWKKCFDQLTAMDKIIDHNL